MEFTLLDAVWLPLIAVWAGALNAVAGGGTFFTFPLLILGGIPPVAANATSKVGLWIGAVGSVRGYWSEIKEAKAWLLVILTLSVIGSAIGSVLLLLIPAERFAALVPWLMLAATASFALGPYARKALQQYTQPSRAGRGLAYAMQLLIGVYAGFFGAGIGILMLALYEWMGLKNIHVMNGLKVAAAVAAHTISSLILVFSALIVWPAALIIMAFSFAGGYGGAYIAKRLPAIWIRRFIIVYGVIVTLYFFAAGT